MNQKYNMVTARLEQMSIEEIVGFLSHYSSRLWKKEEHCRDLIDEIKNCPYITSILASGLTVINNKTYSPVMSEDIYLKAQAIIGYTQKTDSHNYSNNELMFTLGYIELYYKKAANYKYVS